MACQRTLLLSAMEELQRGVVAFGTSNVADTPQGPRLTGTSSWSSVNVWTDHSIVTEPTSNGTEVQ